MPCVGPSDQEMRWMEAAENKRKFGVDGSDLDVATRVACHLAKGESNELTRKWIAEHQRLDDEREAREAEERRRKAADAEIESAAKTIRKKYGLR